MSQVVTFKCPHCGGYLEFDPAKQQYKCLYCGTMLTDQDLQGVGAESSTAQSSPDGSARPQQPLKSYHCQMCGAEIVTDATTAATRCYYCHSPVVLTDRLADDLQPDGVIPFQLDKKGAEEAFRRYIGKKRFIDRGFFSKAQMEDFSGVYYPYWTTDIQGRGVYHGKGTRVSTIASSNYITTTTRVFSVDREGKLTFRHLIRKALNKADGQLSDGIHPYRLDSVADYNPGYLSGFLAEMRDVPRKDAESSMVSEANGYVDNLFERSRKDFATLSGSATFQADQVKTRYLLLPAWVLTYKHRGDGAAYYYMMNGQTGQVCGKLPISWGKLLGTAIAAGGAVFALLCAGGAFLW